jgi:carbamoyl-phosphate synthase large subunit
VLLDRFLDDAIEVDVDAVCDGERVLIGGIMEHIEQAGVHSGDSACSLPPYTLRRGAGPHARADDQAGLALGVRGLMNAQFAIQDDEVYVLEVNPRASRTVPFVSKAIGVPLAKVAARCMVGQTLAEQGLRSEVVPALLRQGGGVPVRQVPRRRHGAGAGDEVHRRGHGGRRELRRGLRQGSGGRRHVTAEARQGHAQRARPPTVRGWCEVARDLAALMGFTLYGTHGTAAARCARRAWNVSVSTRSRRGARTSST